MSVRFKRTQVADTLKEPRKRMHPQNEKFNKNINLKKEPNRNSEAEEYNKMKKFNRELQQWVHLSGGKKKSERDLEDRSLDTI